MLSCSRGSCDARRRSERLFRRSKSSALRRDDGGTAPVPSTGAAVGLCVSVFCARGGVCAAGGGCAPLDMLTSDAAVAAVAMRRMQPSISPCSCSVAACGVPSGCGPVDSPRCCAVRATRAPCTITEVPDCGSGRAAGCARDVAPSTSERIVPSVEWRAFWGGGTKCGTLRCVPRRRSGSSGGCGGCDVVGGGRPSTRSIRRVASRRSLSSGSGCGTPSARVSGVGSRVPRLIRNALPSERRRRCVAGRSSCVDSSGRMGSSSSLVRRPFVRGNDIPRSCSRALRECDAPMTWGVKV